MQTSNPDAIVRAYDLGGFGDIAGAMRVASYLNRIGTQTSIRTKSGSAFKKLELLSPDVDFSLSGSSYPDGAILVDVAGHYRDERNTFNKDVPHHFTEDMDNPRSRRKEVPIYLKTGLSTQPQFNTHVPVQFNPSSQNPMFYRPFREWDLPKPGERDVRAQMVGALTKVKGMPYGLMKKLLPFFKFSELEKILNKTEKVGFVHLSPQIQSYPAELILEHPYFYAVHTAATHSESTLGLGLFVGPDLEKKLTDAALRGYWGVVNSKGEVVKHDSNIPTLFFLGPQPQMTTTGLFLASEMPNLVTGDLSLSDALYGLIAMGGQGFFYETPGWKIPTHVELANILSKKNSALGSLYTVGSNYRPKKITPEQKKSWEEWLAQTVSIFADSSRAEGYTSEMRAAVQDEIRNRFGNVPVEATETSSGGFYIPPGAPYLLQDATARVVETLREDSDTFSEVDSMRKALSDGVPVVVNVQTGVLEPAPAKLENFDFSSLIWSNFDEYYLGENKKKKSFKYSSSLDNIVKNAYTKKSYIQNYIFPWGNYIELESIHPTFKNTYLIESSFV